jgi:hypothetical protein
MRGGQASAWFLAPAPPRTTNTRVEDEGQGTPSACEQPVHRPAPACSQRPAAEPIRSSSSPPRAKEGCHGAAARGRRAHGYNQSAEQELIRPRSLVMPGAELPCRRGRTIAPAWGTACTPLPASRGCPCRRPSIAHVSREGCKGHAKELRAWPRTVQYRHRPMSW